MSEKTLTLLFRLYPPPSREHDLREALILCRGPRRHETGFCRDLRLVCDLLTDFSKALPWLGKRPTPVVPSHNFAIFVSSSRGSSLEKEPLVR